MTIESTISRAKEEIERGRLWRAKEILASSIANYGYSQELLLVLAEVLLKMGDDLDAGKYFLLSVDSPSDSEMAAISTFLTRYNNHSYRSLLKRFPSAVRLEHRDDYPEYLRSYLADIGAPQTFEQSEMSPALNPLLRDRLYAYGCCLFALLAIACMLIGAKTILNWFLGVQ